jgi:hypothetical protein
MEAEMIATLLNKSRNNKSEDQNIQDLINSYFCANVRPDSESDSESDTEIDTLSESDIEPDFDQEAEGQIDLGLDLDLHQDDEANSLDSEFDLAVKFRFVDL